MSVAVLAGGLGTRLRPLVGCRPKVLAPLRGRPYLTHLIDWLARFGVEDVLLLAGYGATDLRATLGERYGNVRLTWSVEPAPLGTGGALRYALAHLASTTLLLNGDSFCDVDLHAFCESHCARKAEASLVLACVSDVSRFGNVETVTDGRVLRFEEKRPLACPGWVNAGIYLLSRSVIELIPPDQPRSLERDLLPALANQEKLLAFRAPGRLLDIGTPEGYAEAIRCLPALPTVE